MQIDSAAMAIAAIAAIAAVSARHGTVKAGRVGCVGCAMCIFWPLVTLSGSHLIQILVGLRNEAT